MMDRIEGARRGELARDRGVSLAATGRRTRMDRAALRLLDVLATSADGTATTDDTVDDLAECWSDGGRWRGSVVLSLARERLIVEVGCVRSARPSRHRGRVTLWGIGDRDAVDRRRLELRAMLAALDNLKKETGEAAGTATPAIEIPPTATKEGTESNG